MEQTSKFLVVAHRRVIYNAVADCEIRDLCPFIKCIAAAQLYQRKNHWKFYLKNSIHKFTKKKTGNKKSRNQ